jgi:hypothetical protein
MLGAARLALRAQSGARAGTSASGGGGGRGGAAATLVAARTLPPSARAVCARRALLRHHTQHPRCRAPRSTFCTPTAALPGERLAGNVKKAKDKDAPSKTWRGYSDRAGESAAQITYSESWLSSLSSLPHSRVLRAISHILLAQVAISAAVVLTFNSGVLGSWHIWEMPHQRAHLPEYSRRGLHNVLSATLI